jgi:hypothetical protein
MLISSHLLLSHSLIHPLFTRYPYLSSASGQLLFLPSFPLPLDTTTKRHHPCSYIPGQNKKIQKYKKAQNPPPSPRSLHILHPPTPTHPTSPTPHDLKKKQISSKISKIRFGHPVFRPKIVEIEFIMAPCATADEADLESRNFTPTTATKGVKSTSTPMPIMASVLHGPRDIRLVSWFSLLPFFVF